MSGFGNFEKNSHKKHNKSYAGSDRDSDVKNSKRRFVFVGAMWCEIIDLFFGVLRIIRYVYDYVVVNDDDFKKTVHFLDLLCKNGFCSLLLVVFVVDILRRVFYSFLSSPSSSEGQKSSTTFTWPFRLHIYPSFRLKTHNTQCYRINSNNRVFS